MSNWYVIHTHAHSEEKALKNLINQNFNVYLPKQLKRRRHARKTETIKAPLFPRYMFVELDINNDCWHFIKSTIGVSKLLCSGNTPVKVPNEIINEIRNHENEMGLVVIDPKSRFCTGDKVRLLDGPFTDVLGLFHSTTDDNRIMILLDILGRNVRVKIDPEFVEIAA